MCGRTGAGDGSGFRHRRSFDGLQSRMIRASVVDGKGGATTAGDTHLGEETMVGETQPASAEGISEEQLRKAEEYVQQEEGAANRLSGWVGIGVTAIAVAMTLFHLYAAYDIVPTIPLRYTHVAFVLTLSFLLFPLADRFRNRIQLWD